MLSCWQRLYDKLLSSGRLDDLMALLALQHLKCQNWRESSLIVDIGADWSLLGNRRHWLASLTLTKKSLVEIEIANRRFTGPKWVNNSPLTFLLQTWAFKMYLESIDGALLAAHRVGFRVQTSTLLQLWTTTRRSLQLVFDRDAFKTVGRFYVLT